LSPGRKMRLPRIGGAQNPESKFKDSPVSALTGGW
jgi:hypothetical protein